MLQSSIEVRGKEQKRMSQKMDSHCTSKILLSKVHILGILKGEKAKYLLPFNDGLGYIEMQKQNDI